jgi:hypothetical protein
MSISCKRWSDTQSSPGSTLPLRRQDHWVALGRLCVCKTFPKMPRALERPTYEHSTPVTPLLNSPPGEAGRKNSRVGVVIKIACNFQAKVDYLEKLRALGRGKCDQCWIEVDDLLRSGEFLEVCGDEFMTDPTTSEVAFQVRALCPECHRQQHLDAQGRHNPCQLSARRNREGV